MVTTLEYAQLSGRAYAATQKNRTPVPAGWAELGWFPDQANGFSAGIYKKSSEIVIAFTGTNADLLTDFAMGNWPLFTGASASDQLTQAMLLYMDTKIHNSGATISFTGHSMGGGLASIMAVFFDRPAVVFDSAPFQKGALNRLDVYANAMQSVGYSDATFNRYLASPISSFLSRQGQVMNTFMQGEFLDPLRWGGTVIGSSAPSVSPGAPVDVSATKELHSLTALASMLASPAFSEAVRANRHLFHQLFDPGLYAQSTETSTQVDLLAHLYNTQVAATSVPLLDRFAADVLRIGVTDTTATSRVAPALAALLVQRPGLRVRVAYGRSDELAAKVREGELDLALVPAYEGQPLDGELLQIDNDPMAGLVRAGHPLLTNSHVALADVVPYGWIAGSSTSAAYKAIGEIFGRQQLPAPRIVIEVPHASELVLEIIASTDLVTLVPRSFMDHAAAGRFMLLPVPQLHVARTVVLLTRHGSTWSVLAIALRELLAGAPGVSRSAKDTVPAGVGLGVTAPRDSFQRAKADR